GDAAVEIIGGDRRAHEQEIVVEVVAVQDAARHRVEEGLGAFRLAVAGQQPHELLLDLLPEGGLAVGEAGRALGRGRVAQRLAQLGGAFAHAHVVVLDALARQLLDAVPVARFEQRLGTLRAVAEQRIVAVEPGQDLARHGQRLRLRGRSLLDALDVAAVDHGRAVRRFRRTARARSACGGSRWCPRRSRTAWRRATGARWDTR